jgi:hypothetical protein
MAVKITHISSFGIWLLTHDKALFLSYEDFPWFKNQTVAAIIQVEEPSPHHFYWPSMDVDLTLEMIEHPDRYPLKAAH